MDKGDKAGSGEQGGSVLWNIGAKYEGDEPDRERPMQEVLSDGSASGWVEGDKPTKVDRFNPSFSAGSGAGMGGSQVSMPATKPQAKAQSRSLSASELKAWADSEIARLAKGEQAAPAVRRLESGDASNGYNTELTAGAEAGYQNWPGQKGDTGGDYDLRGAYAAGYDRDGSGHLPDTFKKPNHETFSDESKYSKGLEHLAGSWEGENFKPGKASNQPPPWLRAYMGDK